MLEGRVTKRLVFPASSTISLPISKRASWTRAYVYDIDKEEWITIQESGELMDVLFLQKKANPTSRA